MEGVNKVHVEISVELGAARIPIHQFLRMGRGAVIELDTAADDDVSILANNVPIATGRVLLRGNGIHISVTRVLPHDPAFRARSPIEVAAGAPLAVDSL